jgi:hypothetical protein
VFIGAPPNKTTDSPICFGWIVKNFEKKYLFRMVYYPKGGTDRWAIAAIF